VRHAKMRNVILILLFFTFTFIASCDDGSKVKFEITNHTSKIIDSIYILPDKALGKNYISLNPNETKDFFTDMSGHGTDGSYVIKYKLDSNSKLQRFGYYTNGASMEKLTKIYIRPDTVLFKFIY
jgi:hypothetical protein